MDEIAKSQLHPFLIHEHDPKQKQMTDTPEQEKFLQRYPLVSFCLNEQYFADWVGDVLIDRSKVTWKGNSKGKSTGLQDITNINDEAHVPTSELMFALPYQQIQNVVLRVIQDEFQAVEITLVASSPREATKHPHLTKLTFVFLPGPQAHRTNHVKLASMLKSFAAAATNKSPLGKLSTRVVEEKPIAITKAPAASASGPTNEDVSLSSLLIQRFLDTRKGTPESYHLAAQIEEDYMYIVGPTSAVVKDCRTDKTYRMGLLKRLQDLIRHMSETKKVDVKKREDAIGIRCEVDDEDGINKFYDIHTGENVSAATYEERYREYIGCPEITYAEQVQEYIPESNPSDPKEKAISPVVSESKVPEFSDLETEQIAIPQELFGSSQEQEAKTRMEAYTQQTSELEAVLWEVWDNALEDFHRELMPLQEQLQEKFAQLIALKRGQGQETLDLQDSVQEEDPSVPVEDKKKSRKSKSRSRRRSLIAPPPEDLDDLDDGVDKGDATPDKKVRKDTSRRKSRRKSLIMPSNLDDFDDNMEDPNDKGRSSVCEICCEFPSTVVLAPCQHTMCKHCSERLMDNTQDSQLRCPWDRQVVELQS